MKEQAEEKEYQSWKKEATAYLVGQTTDRQVCVLLLRLVEEVRKLRAEIRSGVKVETKVL